MRVGWWLSFGAASVLVLLAGEGLTFAQFQGVAPLLREGANINAHEINPNRDLTLPRSELEATSGVTINLSDGAVAQPVIIPLGAGYGVVPELEVGADFKVDLNSPAPFSAVRLETPRLYGRYAVLENNIAVEGSIFIPVGKFADRFAYRLEAPVRFAVSHDFLIYGAATYNGLFGGETFPYVHVFQIGGAAMYRFAEKFWAAFEVGLTFINFDPDHIQLPIGLSAGFEVLPRIIVLPGLRFPDIGHSDQRAFSLLVVYAFDLGIGHTGGESTPDIPPS